MAAQNLGTSKFFYMLPVIKIRKPHVADKNEPYKTRQHFLCYAGLDLDNQHVITSTMVMMLKEKKKKMEDSMRRANANKRLHVNQRVSGALCVEIYLL